MEFGLMPELCSFFLFLSTSSGQPQINSELVRTAKSSFFFSLKNKLHQLSVMSCQESYSSKELHQGIGANSPPFKITIIIIIVILQVFSL